MKNESGLVPKGRAVLVKPLEVEKKNSLIELPPTVRGRMDMVETKVEVIAIGPECWKDETQPRAQVGDIVLITAFAGAMAAGPKDGKTYRLINDRDIYCGVEEEQT